MGRFKGKRGFTFIEVMISGAILVAVMALITIFYTKASKIRIAVSKESNTQVIAANQMMDAILSGMGNSADGLMCATRIENLDTTSGESPLWIIFVNNTSGTANYVRLRIDTDIDGSSSTLYQETGSTLPPSIPPWDSRNLDPNDKISLTNESWFACYNSRDEIILTPDSNKADIAKIEICLTVKDKALPESQPFVLRQAVTMRNIFHID